jgi:hypothetical protein
VLRRERPILLPAVFTFPARVAVLRSRRDCRHCREHRDLTLLVIVRGTAAVLPRKVLRARVLPAATATAALLLRATIAAASDYSPSVWFRECDVRGYVE